jgi:hypothetical protein
MTPSATAPQPANGRNGFPQAPELVRLSYFYGQLLGVKDFQTEQQYFLDKLRLLNRCLHGHGVVCGLGVSPGRGGTSALPAAPAPDVVAALRKLADLPPDQVNDEAKRLLGELTAQAKQGGTPATTADGDPCPVPLQIGPGLALDREGHELLVRSPLLIPDVWKLLDDKDKAAIKEDVKNHQPVRLYVSLSYREVSFDPTRRALADACSGATGSQYGRVRDDVCVRVTLEPPDESDACTGCCEPPPADCGEYLARIDKFVPGQPLSDTQIHNEVRRPCGTYRHTRVESVSWIHGNDYSLHKANELLHHGLEIHLTGPVQHKTLVDGIVEVLVLPRYAWQPREVRTLSGHVKGWPDEEPNVVRFVQPEPPHDPCARLSEACRVHVIFRSAHVLDRCCQPVDGAHVGGWVPSVEKAKHPAAGGPCGAEGGYRPATSGSGAPGINFESWFFVHCR